MTVPSPITRSRAACTEVHAEVITRLHVHQEIRHEVSSSLDHALGVSLFNPQAFQCCVQLRLSRFRIKAGFNKADLDLFGDQDECRNEVHAVGFGDLFLFIGIDGKWTGIMFDITADCAAFFAEIDAQHHQPLSLNFSLNRSTIGSDARHGSHQVAQKSSKTALPWRDFKSILSLAMLTAVN
jgi:hypothetical protein